MADKIDQLQTTATLVVGFIVIYAAYKAINSVQVIGERVKESVSETVDTVAETTSGLLGALTNPANAIGRGVVSAYAETQAFLARSQNPSPSAVDASGSREDAQRLDRANTKFYEEQALRDAYERASFDAGFNAMGDVGTIYN